MGASAAGPPDELFKMKLLNVAVLGGKVSVEIRDSSRSFLIPDPV